MVWAGASGSAVEDERWEFAACISCSGFGIHAAADASEDGVAVFPKVYGGISDHCVFGGGG